MDAVFTLAKPAEHAEDRLITAVLAGTYPAGTALPNERDLAVQLGVTRPTLREALQRLSRDGWLVIRQGKPTMVNDFWRDGGLNVLSVLVRHQAHLSADFVANLLAVQLDFAPSYARAAIQHNPRVVAKYVAGWTTLVDTPEAFAAFDWGLHRTLTIAANNPIYTLILNGFAGFYESMARRYFANSSARAASGEFYVALHHAATIGDADAAATITRTIIEASLEFWAQVK